jgi:hypothetical protein
VISHLGARPEVSLADLAALLEPEPRVKLPLPHRRPRARHGGHRPRRADRRSRRRRSHLRAGGVGPPARSRPRRPG